MTDPSLDPFLFHDNAIAPATRAFNRRIEQVARRTPPVWTMSPREARELRESWPPLALVDGVETRRIDGPGGPLGLRIFRAEPCVGFYLHFHAGGWVLGGAHHQDPRLARIAAETGLTVVSVDYRLAPENPYPAAPDDAEHAALWLVRHGARELAGPEWFAIGGESAGAELAVVALVRLRDRHDARPFGALVASYGTFDLGATPSARETDERSLNFDRATFEWYVGHFVPAELRQDPDVSPLFARLHELPPALFTVGTLDPVLDDTLFMHARWIAAGNRAELAIHPGGVHGFDEFKFPLAESAHQRIHGFLRDGRERANT